MSRKTMSVRVNFSPRELRLTHSIFGAAIKMDNARVDPQPGAPGFPTRIVHVALPAGYQASRATGRVERAEPLTDAPTFVAPVREKQISLTDFQEPGAPVGGWAPPLKARYRQAIKAMKRSVVRLVGTKVEGSIQIAEVAVQPVRYDEAGALELVTELKLTVTLKPLAVVHPRTLLAQRRTAWSERRVVMAATRVVNPKALESVRINVPKFAKLDEAKAVRAEVAQADMAPAVTAPAAVDAHPGETSGGSPPPGGGPPSGGAPVPGSTPVSVPAEIDYLIITDQNTWDADALTPVASIGDLPATFARLANWKRGRGLRTHIATVTSGSGVTLPSPRPLRTVRATFTAHGSSLEKAP